MISRTSHNLYNTVPRINLIP